MTEDIVSTVGYGVEILVRTATIRAYDRPITSKIYFAQPFSYGADIRPIAQMLKLPLPVDLPRSPNRSF